MNKKRGFTIVELLIVIVVIAILAAITIVAYNGIQARARDSQRLSDMKTIAKALEMYYADKGEYPYHNKVALGSTSINAYWATSYEASSWANLEAALSPYISKLPKDPLGSGGDPRYAVANNYNYGYFGNQGMYCGVGAGQMYILVMQLEGSQQDTFVGDCGGTAAGPYPASDYRVVK